MHDNRDYIRWLNINNAFFERRRKRQKYFVLLEKIIYNEKLSYGVKSLMLKKIDK